MTLSEYESHLDALRRSVSLQGDRVMLNFSEPFSISLSDCTTDADLIRQVLLATVRLLEEPSMHLTYVAHAIIQTARAFKITYSDAERLYAPHVIEIIDDAVRCPSTPLRFDNSSSELEGIHAIAFHRDLEPRTTTKVGSVRVTRPWHCHGQYMCSAAAREVEVLTTRTHIVFSFNGQMAWNFPTGAARDGPVGRSSRIALHHKMSADEVIRVIDDTRTIFDGLDFRHTAL